MSQCLHSITVLVLFAMAGGLVSAQCETEMVINSSGAGPWGWGEDVAINATAGIAAVGHMSYVPDGFLDEYGAVLLFDIETGALLATIEGDTDAVCAYGAYGGCDFGASLAFNDSGTVLAVGSPYYAPEKDGVARGAVYMYNIADLSSIEEIVIIGPELDDYASNGFGVDLDISGNTMIVGAPYTSVGDDSNNGAAYVYDIAGLFSPDDPFDPNEDLVHSHSGLPSDQLGYSVAIDGNAYVVGMPFYNNALGYRRGAVQLYVVGVGQALLFPGEIVDDARSVRFGWDVDIDDGRVAVGAFFADNNVPFNQEAYHSVGAAYVYSYGVEDFGQGPEVVLGDMLEVMVLETNIYYTYAFAYDVALEGDYLFCTAVVDGLETGKVYSTTLQADPASYTAVTELDLTVEAAGIGVYCEIDGGYLIVGGSLGKVLVYDAVPSGCNAADLAEPYCVLDLADITAFLDAFSAGDMIADLAEPYGILDLDDITTFLIAHSAGCP